MQIQQVAIAESNNPSGLYRVIAYEENGQEHIIQTLVPQTIPVKGRMKNIFIEKTPYKVASIKLEFDGAALTDYLSIDAIAIRDRFFFFNHRARIRDLRRDNIPARKSLSRRIRASLVSFH